YSTFIFIPPFSYVQNDIIPCWDCYVDNIPSQKLASKLSFYNPIEYRLFVRKKTGE
ncbi:GNAT family N-acetyltransferase, partial [Bacillus sp. D-CC]